MKAVARKWRGKKKREVKAFGTLKDPQWQSNMGNKTSWYIPTPAGLPKCSSTAPPATLRLTVTSHFHIGCTLPVFIFCITPLKSHSLTNGKECKGIRCIFFQLRLHFFQQPAPGIKKKKSWSSARPYLTPVITSQTQLCHRNSDSDDLSQTRMAQKTWTLKTHLWKEQKYFSWCLHQNFSEILSSDLHSVKLRYP